MKYLIKIVIIFLLFFILCSFIQKETELNKFKNLFIIERSRNTDKVIYDINITQNNTIDKLKPLHVYWCKNSNINNKESLTYIQNKHGYGAKIVKQSSKECHFTIAAIPDQIFVVKEDEKSEYKSHTTFDNKEVKVNSIYIAFKEGTVWVPEIDSIQLICTDCISKTEIVKTIISE